MKWTDNAGFWVEDHENGERTYHCSPGQCNPPDFDALVFQISFFDTRSSPSRLEVW
jgi:hypothetical protein